MGKLKILKDNVEALIFDFDTSQIFSKTTELASLEAVSKSLYCGTGQCYNCLETQCNQINCNQVQCNQVQCNQVQCTQVKCTQVRCSKCSLDVANDSNESDCKD